MLALLLSWTGPLIVVLAVIHVIICLFLVAVVLLQRGRAGDLASAFGGGPSQTNMAAMSTEDFMTRATKIAAFAFMFTSLMLGLFAYGRRGSVLDEVPGDDTPAAATSPADPTAADTAATPAPDATIETAPAAETAPIEIAPATEGETTLDVPPPTDTPAEATGATP